MFFIEMHRSEILAKLVSFAKNTNLLKISQIFFAKVSRKNRLNCYIFCKGFGAQV